MKLVSFSVQNYRSITTAHKIKVGPSTIILGPNNEGKSNVLRGLITAMRLIRAESRTLSSVASSRVVPVVRRHSVYSIYDWYKDFPVSLRDSHPDGESVFILEFELTDSEIDEFEQAVGSRVNEKLPIRLAVGRHGTRLKVNKRGRWATALSKKSTPISRFITRRIQFEYIEAVRTAKSAERVVDSLVADQLRVLESSTEYQNALAVIDKVQKPVLDSLGRSIRETLVKFLPAIEDVRFEITAERRFSALRRSATMIIDDGTPTSLEYKGDGVQSLAALALMRHSSESTSSGKNFIIAVEEPESHLHPHAMHGLKAVLQGLAQRHQVVVTTHSPVFVDRTQASSNVIVQDGKARVAGSIKEIREILGVKASDNLLHAELVLIVEGTDDATALVPLLSTASSRLANAFKDGRLAIDTLNGATNLSYKASLIKQALCSYYCFLDNDESARRSFEKAEAEALVDLANATFATCQGRADSELEDLYDVELYKQIIFDDYGVSLDAPTFGGRGKWSDRMAATFKVQGKPWSDKLEMQVKQRVAELVAASPSTALNPHVRNSFDALVTGLEGHLPDITKGKARSKPPGAARAT
jgi:putative ATP-dependent endonuclease of OLD family